MMGETVSLSGPDRSTDDDEYSAERYCDIERLLVNTLSRDPRDLPKREEVGGGVSSPPPE